MAESLPNDELGNSVVTADVHVVSNRQPYRHEYDEGETVRGGTAGGRSDRGVTVDRPTGGLTAGLDPVMRRLGGTWTAWGDGEADFAVSDDSNCVAVPPEDPQYTLQRIPLSDEEVAGYYEGYANRTLWPLCHAQIGNVRFDADDWETYRTVNRKFAAVTAGNIDDDSTVWFQDYHFALAPRYLRAETDALLMQFWHIPWPAADVFRTAPHDEALLKGLLANDLLGFHVPLYCSNFLECVDELLEGATVDWAEGRVHYGDRPTQVEFLPLAVDAPKSGSWRTRGPTTTRADGSASNTASTPTGGWCWGSTGSTTPRASPSGSPHWSASGRPARNSAVRSPTSRRAGRAARASRPTGNCRRRSTTPSRASTTGSAPTGGDRWSTPPLTSPRSSSTDSTGTPTSRY